MRTMRWSRESGLPELLSPAGDRERLEAAVRFGADAVYLAGKEFGMRTACPNFGMDELASAAEYAHGAGVRVYLACNSVMRNGDYDRLPAFLAGAKDAGVDAFILTDLGALDLARKYAPGVAVHISTQAGVAGWAAANAFYRLGAKRVVLARELTLEEIAEIRAKTPEDLELEAFVHGAMCVSFSGRCLLSEYLAGRDADRGNCAQPCRWKYALVEETRPGRYMPVAEDGGGSYILNSRDLCMVRHIPKMARAGVGSLKIEGRAKSAYYTAVATNAYRRALDEFARDPDAPLSPWIPEELEKISHREYSTGFYLGGTPGQVSGNGGYVRGWEVIAVCEGMRGGYAVLSERNRFFRGDTASVLEPGAAPYELRLAELFDDEENPLDCANRTMMTVLVRTERPLAKGAILRKRTGDV
ncbi:MAG: U32 family peptidase [Oscillospiraceae bacterium]|nr:U32 family peptidase [Oscillospiraceae bacterium]MCI1989985.1 U32 family peptidase [Oscillospiraceae bacterium]MCI2034843.1 U32 family peptidase [Oscillospiraceae bacterium]